MTESAPLDYPDDVIRDILRKVRTIAVVGASANRMRPSYGVAAWLQSRGYKVVPVNPNESGGTILGETCFADLHGIPDAIDMIDIFRRSDAVPGLVEEALGMKPRPTVIWMQLGVRHDAAAARAESQGITVIMDRCPKIELARLSGATG